MEDDGGRVPVGFDDDEDVKIFNVRAAGIERAELRGIIRKAALVADHLGQAPRFVRKKRISIITNGQWYYGLSLCMRSGARVAATAGQRR